METNTSSFVEDSEDDEEKNRDWLISDFLGTVLPSVPLFSSSQTETGNEEAPNGTFPGMLSRLFSNIIVDRPSLFRVQFYNSDLEDSNPSDDDNSTSPNAVFGSPLCLGLCIPVQVSDSDLPNKINRRIFQSYDLHI